MSKLEAFKPAIHRLLATHAYRITLPQPVFSHSNAAGLLQRELTLSNILLARAAPHVADFGLAQGHSVTQEYADIQHGAPLIVLGALADLGAFDNPSLPGPLKIQIPWRQPKSDEAGLRSNQQR